MLAATLGAGCTVRLVADYDPVLDRGITDLARDVDAFLARMEQTAGTPPGAYSTNVSFYADSAATVRILRLRAESAAKGEDIAQALSDVLVSIEDLRAVHAGRGDRGLPGVAIQTARAGLETQFRSLFVIEAALLRRGR